MNSSQSTSDTPNIAVWYFVGATFIFAVPALFMPEAEIWLRVLLFSAGFVAVIGGGIQLGREIKQRSASRVAASSKPPTEHRGR
jgi:protein-S-isoprenylcysteine O-methyltransferase Ste14